MADYQPPKPKVITYELPGGWIVLAGATDEDNDALSTGLAKPDDWWFHAAAVPGSHVILRARKDVEPGKETLRQAAGIAAWHSKARNAKTVDVHCTLARHVRKPRGVKTGTVEVAKGKNMIVHPGIAFATKLKDGEGDADPLR